MGKVLGRQGEHLGSVLGHLEESRPKAKQRVDEYLAAIVCDLQSVHRRYEGMYMTVEMQAGTGPRRSPVRFTANETSDGTLRSAALLAALFQPWALEGRIPLVAIEEPKTSTCSAVDMETAGEAITVASVVEGHGEVAALPEVLRRIAKHLALTTTLKLRREPRAHCVAEPAIDAHSSVSVGSFHGRLVTPRSKAAIDDSG